MFLTPTNVAVYLIHAGIVPSASVVHDGFFLVETGRRNRNFKIFQGSRQGLFIKQIKSADPLAMATLQHEAAFYRRLDDSRVGATTRQLIPRLIHHDPSRHVLIVELVPDAQSVDEYCCHDIHRLHATASQFGNALADLHTQLRLLFHPSEQSLFPQRLPWELTLDLTGHQTLWQLGPGGVQLSSALQRLPGFEILLGSLRALWQWETVIHGDIKWENTLLSHGAESPAPLLHFVDWELVDFGDSAWDVASVLKEHIVCGLFTLINGSSAPTAGADAVVAACAASAREFFQHYICARRIPSSLLPMYAGRCIRFAGARLVTAVPEYLYSSSTPTYRTDLLLQTALSFLQQPQQAAWNVLGTEAV